MSCQSQHQRRHGFPSIVGRDASTSHRRNPQHLVLLPTLAPVFVLVVVTQLVAVRLVVVLLIALLAPSSLADLRGASRSLDSVRMASKSKKKPPTTSSPADDVRRWRDGAAAPRDAEIARLGVERRVPVHVEDDDAIRRL